jgi:hypothetical protein
MNLMIDRAAECEFFGRSLFFVGEFGVNDYHLSLKKLSVQQVRSLVPDVIETISMAIEVSAPLIAQQTVALLHQSGCG